MAGKERFYDRDCREAQREQIEQHRRQHAAERRHAASRSDQQGVDQRGRAIVAQRTGQPKLLNIARGHRVRRSHRRDGGVQRMGPGRQAVGQVAFDLADEAVTILRRYRLQRPAQAADIIGDDADGLGHG